MDKRSWDFDWSKLGRAYHAAHDLAIARYHGEQAMDLGGVPMVAASELAAKLAGERGAAQLGDYSRDAGPNA